MIVFKFNLEVNWRLMRVRAPSLLLNFLLTWTFLNLEVQSDFRLQIANTGLSGAQVKASLGTQSEGKSKYMCVSVLYIVYSNYHFSPWYQNHLGCLLKMFA